MALDPSISLDVRPPQFQIQIPQPLQQFQQVLTLQDLMTKGQANRIALQSGMLQLQQQQQALREQQWYADYLRKLYGGDAGTAVPPVTAPVPSPQPAISLPPSAIPGALVPPASPAPAAPDLGLPATPGGILSPILSPLPNAPNVPPVISPVPNAPNIPPAISPIPNAPVTTTPGIGMPAPSAAVPGGLVGLDPSEILRNMPRTGAEILKNQWAMQKEYFDMQDKALALHKSQSTALGSLINGVTDNESLAKNVAYAVQQGWLPSAEGSRLISQGFNDPRTQATLKEHQQQALTYAEAIDTAIKQNAENRQRILFPAQYAEGIAKQRDAEATAAANSIGDVKDVKDLPKWLAQQGTTAQIRYGDLVTSNLPLDQIKQVIQMGAGGSEKAALAAAAEAAKIEAEQKQYQPIADLVNQDPSRWAKLSKEVQDKVLPLLAKTQFTGFGPTISDAERQRLGDYDRAQTILNESLKKLNDPNNTALMGPVEGLAAKNPYATDHRVLRDYLVQQQQELKKFVTNGSLKGLTEKQLDALFPTITTHPVEAAGQVRELMNTIARERQSYIRDLGDKLIPRSMTGEPPAPAPTGAPAPAGPAYKTIDEERPRSTIRIVPSGQGTVRMRAPGPKGTVKDIPADQVDFYKSRGATVVQ